jgi:Soluble lytic murein transglycosylase and related regulatory proteins (some contain LysM/invasin domains)
VDSTLDEKALKYCKIAANGQFKFHNVPNWQMKRYLVSIFIIVAVVSTAGYFFFRDYWEHRFDSIISKQSTVYRLDDRLIWSVVYEETWFRSWKIGSNDEVGLMQVTPLVARDWAHETGLKEYERQTSNNVVEFLRDPEHNIQIGCWYLERLRENYRGQPAETAMALAAYNAGPSRVEEWTRGADDLSENGFVNRISIPSTKAYVISILARYRTAPSLRNE